MKALIALGGNAFVGPGQRGEIEEQFANIELALRDTVKLIADGHKIILTHGNGFQVGNIITRCEISRDQAYQIPLYVADAQTQGEIGFLIQQSLKNHLVKAKIPRAVVTVLTQVIVDRNDTAFSNPTKPVGSYYTREQVELLKRPGEVWVEDSGRGWRKVVPSPAPKDIVEKEVIKELFELGVIVIACGGGGIPVVYQDDRLTGVDAVIDKDLASALLAYIMDVDRLIILTGVGQVALNFGKPDQLWLERLSVSQARRYLIEGHFPSGSMGPKIESAILYLTLRSEGEVIITSLENLYLAFYGRGGTRIEV
jgi:carbamate kinase